MTSGELLKICDESDIDVWLPTNPEVRMGTLRKVLANAHVAVLAVPVPLLAHDNLIVPEALEQAFMHMFPLV